MTMKVGREYQFADAYADLFRASSDLINGRLEPSTGMAVAANMAALDKLINTEIKLNQIESATRQQILLGDRRIFKENDNRVIDTDAVRHITSTSNESSGAEGVVTRLPRIGVCGLTSTQAGAITADFAESAEFTFWHDDGVPRLRSMSSLDMVFVNKGQIAHKTTDILKSMKANCVIVEPGVTNMKAAIRSYCQDLLNGK